MARSRVAARAVSKRQRHRLQEADIDLAVDDVHVAVDQARHQRAPAAIDDLGARLLLIGVVAQFAHAVVLDQQLVAARAARRIAGSSSWKIL